MADESFGGGQEGPRKRKKSEAELPTLSQAQAADLYLPTTFPFKQRQAEARQGRQYKNLRKILQQESYETLPADEPTYINIEAPPSLYPTKKYCDLTGLEAPYTDPKTKLRYANAATFAAERRLTDIQAQGYLSLRRAAKPLK